ncbi:MAG TPA: hypothetical protein VF065_10405, partial [Ilumatobacter sp.]
MHSIVTDVTVERDDQGGLVVEWTIEGPDRGVEVAAGPRPDRIDHARAVAVAPGQRSLHVEKPASTRSYFSVSPAGGGSGLVAAERRVPFEG